MATVLDSIKILFACLAVYLPLFVVVFTTFPITDCLVNIAIGEIFGQPVQIAHAAYVVLANPVSDIPVEVLMALGRAEMMEEPDVFDWLSLWLLL